MKHYYKDYTTKEGMCQTMETRNKYQKQLDYYYCNRAKINEQRKEYRKRNAVQISAYNKEYYRKKKESKEETTHGVN